MSENPYQTQIVDESDPQSRGASGFDLKSRICVASTFVLLFAFFTLGLYAASLPLAQRTNVSQFMLALVPACFGLTFVALHDGYKSGAYSPRNILGLIIPLWLHSIWVLWYFLRRRPKYLREPE